MNNATIIVPRNMVIDLPANRLTAQEFFDQAPADCKAKGMSGLSQEDDCIGAVAGFPTVLANKVDNSNIIAGEIMMEKDPESVTGIITSINYDEGYFRINENAATGNPGTMIRPNDPESRHTIQTGLGCVAGNPNCSADPRYTNDPDNYTFVFSNGFPLCIPSTISRSAPFALTPGGAVTTVTAQSDPSGNGDAFGPQDNRIINPVADSRRFAPIRVGDWINAEGNLETVGTTSFFSAHTITLGNALATANNPNQPDYMIFDEVEMDAPGFNNERVFNLFIGFTTLPDPPMTIHSLPIDPATGLEQERLLVSVVGCNIASGGPGNFSLQGVGATAAGIFKIRYDVDFPQGAPVDPDASPCAQLRAAFPALNICPNGGTREEEFGILQPLSRDIIGYTNHVLNPGIVTVDINGQESQNGSYSTRPASGIRNLWKWISTRLLLPLFFRDNPGPMIGASAQAGLMFQDNRPR